MPGALPKQEDARLDDEARTMRRWGERKENPTPFIRKICVTLPLVVSAKGLDDGENFMGLGRQIANLVPAHI